MYFTKENIIAVYPNLTEAEAERYGKLATALIDKEVGYNLLNTNRGIRFMMKNPTKRIELPFGKINSIIDVKLDGVNCAVDFTSDNILYLEEPAENGQLVINVNAGQGANGSSIDGLSDVFYGVIEGLINVQKARGENGNLSSITIGELSKSYNTKITNEQAVAPLGETVLQPYQELLEKYKYLFVFDNERFLI